MLMFAFIVGFIRGLLGIEDEVTVRERAGRNGAKLRPIGAARAPARSPTGEEPARSIDRKASRRRSAPRLETRSRRAPRRASQQPSAGGQKAEVTPPQPDVSPRPPSGVHERLSGQQQAAADGWRPRDIEARPAPGSEPAPEPPARQPQQPPVRPESRPIERAPAEPQPKASGSTEPETKEEPATPGGHSPTTPPTGDEGSHAETPEGPEARPKTLDGERSDAA